MCEHCDMGWVLWGEEGLGGEITYCRVPCSRCVVGLRAAGVPERYLAAELEDFSAEGEGLAAELLGWDCRAPGWRIEGPVGTGKTHLVVGLVKRLLGRDVFACFVDAPDLIAKMKASIDTETRQQAAMELRWINRAEVLVLDDLGAERPTEFAEAELALLIAERHKANRPLVVTTNLSLGQLSERLGDRIASRLAEMTRPLVLTGEDRRLRRVG